MSGPGLRPRGRLRRSDCSGPGISRRRRGSGFSYLDPEGGSVRDEDTLERIRALAIPPAWRDLRSEDVNTYLQEKAGEEVSAKDFRTWHGTVLAAVELSREGAPRSKGGAERAIRAAVKRVAERLGNTPAVCRSSYIAPQVLDRFRDGRTIELPNLAPEGTVTPRQRSSVERRVLELID